mmetsp:Transcript_156818/g.503264  ORF Transcript_156818/g.503264 Transcript_156818/m.503264 type:complete len:235 (+) Transcript_156818:1007-1711(+)
MLLLRALSCRANWRHCYLLDLCHGRLELLVLSLIDRRHAIRVCPGLFHDLGLRCLGLRDIDLGLNALGCGRLAVEVKGALPLDGLGRAPRPNDGLLICTGHLPTGHAAHRRLPPAAASGPTLGGDDRGHVRPDLHEVLRDEAPLSHPSKAVRLHAVCHGRSRRGACTRHRVRAGVLLVPVVDVGPPRGRAPHLRSNSKACSQAKTMLLRGVGGGNCRWGWRGGKRSARPWMVHP